MTINNEMEFNKIISDILKNEEFISLKYEMHHGISRLDHSLSVAKLTFATCQKLGIKSCAETTRAALLHDFFKNSEVPHNSFVNHPKKSLENARKHFKLTKKQENIINSHMFPAGNILPKYKESWLVSWADKTIAIKECTKYKIPLTVGSAYLFFLNFLLIQR